MSEDAFERALAFVLEHEGIDSNDPRDPGGRTRFGISRARYPDEDIEQLTRERAAELFRRDFWDLLELSRLPEELAIAVFDAAVNAGPTRAVEWLQEGLNAVLPVSDRLAVDGRAGPKTFAACWRVACLGSQAAARAVLQASSHADRPACGQDILRAAATAASQAGGAGAARALELARKEMLMARLRYYSRLAARRPLDAFLRGWLNRTLDMDTMTLANLSITAEEDR